MLSMQFSATRVQPCTARDTMIAQVAVTLALLGSPGPPMLPDSLPAPQPDAWVSPDKAKHFLIAGFVESATFAGLETMGARRNSAFAGALGMAGAVSVIRELHDGRTKNNFSFRDLTWDLAGGIAAFLVLRHAERP